VATYLLSSSPYRVLFVNPRVESILGQRVYPCLAHLPESPDLVEVFRKPSDLPQVLGHARDAGAATLWLQLGLWDLDVAADAETPDWRS